MFKTLVTGIALLLASLHRVESAMTMEQMTKIASGFRNVCQPKTGVDMAILEGMQKGEFPEDRKFQCYLKCVMGMLRTLRNGKVDLDMLLKQVDTMVPENLQERTRHVARHCSTVATSNDMCEIAYQFVKCNWDTDAEVFFFP
ncbi:Odorant binding protein 1 [Cephus cinctus]|uniref:Odorant binding protein 1 n=1 Tax=Cephus cinctus TaxID=211228 RepID=A0A1W6L160_CEPCN|nr:odorant binding protein 1 [Cephus cinctus]RLZ02197.1 Odorant binding protein 1 [Cephus cinctus]